MKDSLFTRLSIRKLLTTLMTSLEREKITEMVDHSSIQRSDSTTTHLRISMENCHLHSAITLDTLSERIAVKLTSNLVSELAEMI